MVWEIAVPPTMTDVYYIYNIDSFEFEGIKLNSLFDKFNYFHVCNPDMPPCLGHDLFVVDYDFKLYIDYWMNQRQWFADHDLNTKFPGSDINNKSGEINFNKSKLGGNAVHNCCLLMKLLQIWVAQQIFEKSHNVWKHLLCLREIVQLLCALQISWDEVGFRSGNRRVPRGEKINLSRCKA